MSPKVKGIIIGILFMVLVLLVFFGRKSDFSPGEKLPSFTLNSLDNRPFSFPDNEHFTVIHFWTTFCDTCIEEADEMEAFYNTFHEKGVEIYAINIEPGNREKIQEFVQKFNWKFPVLLDPDNKTGKLYRITGVPETLVALPDGRLALKRIIGPAMWTSPLFRKRIEELLQKK